MNHPSNASQPDITKPNVARMYDFYLGGKDNSAVDRDAAMKVLAVAPEVPIGALENRAFLRRALRFLVKTAGIRQFIDIGPGLPTQNNVHHIAQHLDPNTRVAYVDRDPVVLTHGRALLANNNPNVTMIDGDLREPEKLLADPALRRLINLDEPLALLMTLVLQFIPDDEDAHGLVATYCNRLPRGSYLVISHVTGDDRGDDVLTPIAQTYEHATAPLVMRSRSEIRRFFSGLDLLPPGVVYLSQWQPYLTEDAAGQPGSGGTRWAYAGVGHKTESGGLKTGGQA